MQANYVLVQNKDAIQKERRVPTVPITSGELLRLMFMFNLIGVVPISHSINLAVRVDPIPIIMNPSTDAEYTEAARVSGMSKAALKIKHQRILKGSALYIYPIRMVMVPHKPMFLASFPGQLQRLNYVDAQDLGAMSMLPFAPPKSIGLVLSHSITLGKKNWVAIRTHALTKFSRRIVTEFETALRY